MTARGFCILFASVITASANEGKSAWDTPTSLRREGQPRSLTSRLTATTALSAACRTDSPRASIPNASATRARRPGTSAD